MILFRLISFGIRLISTLVFVFILQIKFDGKTLEYYLIRSGKKFVGTEVLHRVGEDSVKMLRGLSTTSKRQTINRKLSSEILPKIEKFTKKIELPYEEMEKHKNLKPESQLKNNEKLN